MRTLKSKATVLIGLGLILAFPLLAQKSGPERCGKACAIPDLTPEQTMKIQKLKLDFEKAILALQTDMKTKRLEFRALVVERADQKKLEAKIDEMAKASADIQKKALAHRNEIRNLLTDAQKKFFDQKCSGMGCSTGMGRGGGCQELGCGRHGKARMGHGGHGSRQCGSPKDDCKK
jgi:Spy/CpxP family protein refolding chaperone